MADERTIRDYKYILLYGDVTWYSNGEYDIWNSLGQAYTLEVITSGDGENGTVEYFYFWIDQDGKRYQARNVGTQYAVFILVNVLDDTDIIYLPNPRVSGELWAIQTRRHELRNAGYYEDFHDDLIKAITETTEEKLGENPFEDYESFDVDIAYMGAGATILSYPSMMDIYNQIAVEDELNVIYNTALEKTIDLSKFTTKVNTQAMMLSVIADEQMGTFSTEMRDLNCVNSSAFIIGKTRLEKMRNRRLNEYALKTAVHMLNAVGTFFNSNVSWHYEVCNKYQKIMNFYWTDKLGVQTSDYEHLAMKVLWPFTLWEIQRACYSVIQADRFTPRYYSEAVGEPIDINYAFTCARYGAQIGYYIGSWFGAAVGMWIGGVIGIIIEAFWD